MATGIASLQIWRRHLGLPAQRSFEPASCHGSGEANEALALVRGGLVGRKLGIGIKTAGNRRAEYFCRHLVGAGYGE